MLAYKPGERICVIGKSGSGKTTLLLHLAWNSPTAPVIVFNTKHDNGYHRMIEKRDRFKELPLRLRSGQSFVLIEPDGETVADPDDLDDMLVQLSESKNITVVIDEAYMFHTAGQAGPGLTGLLTRGRSRGQTTIIGTQRPAWVSRFVFSEATQGYCGMLNTRDDQKIISGYFGLPKEDFENIPKFTFLHADLEGRTLPERLQVQPFVRSRESEFPVHKRYSFV